MNINEIENTLQSLKSRHPNLDEGLLMTLLKAGGWEEKDIKDAITIFRVSGYEKSDKQKQLPVLEKENVLPEVADMDHMLLEHNQEVSVGVGELEQKTESLIEEESEPKTETVLKSEEPLEQKPEIILKTEEELPEHLLETTSKEAIEPENITEAISQVAKEEDKEELPSNLPVKPFDSDDNTLPFSKYKELFFDAITPQHKDTKEIEVDQKSDDFVKSETETPKTNESVDSHNVVEKTSTSSDLYISKTPLASHDEKLIRVAILMLVLVLSLLYYMYMNNRI